MNTILDYRASTKTVDALKKLGLNIVKTTHLNHVYTTICGHADIMLHKLDECTVVVEPTTYEYFKKMLPNIKVIKGDTILQEKYPFDIAYNAARIGKNLFCYEKYTDNQILEYCNENNIKIINTKQGYAKCSICIISDDAIITSDKNIALQAEKNNIDVLMIVNDNKIKLIGFDNGFIGGATGLIRKDVLVVNGNINLHTDAEKILSFSKKHNVEIISLNDEDITDIGSILVI